MLHLIYSGRVVIILINSSKDYYLSKTYFVKVRVIERSILLTKKKKNESDSFKEEKKLNFSHLFGKIENQSVTFHPLSSIFVH